MALNREPFGTKYLGQLRVKSLNDDSRHRNNEISIIINSNEGHLAIDSTINFNTF